MARFDDAESAKKIRKAPLTILCGIALRSAAKFPHALPHRVVDRLHEPYIFLAHSYAMCYYRS